MHLVVQPLDPPYRAIGYSYSYLAQPEKGVITKGVFSLEKSLESLNSLESLGNDPILLCFPQSGDSLESRHSLKSLENGHFEKTPFPKDPFFRSRLSHLCFSGIARYRDICPEIGPIAAEGRGWQGGIAAQAALGRVSRYGGVSLR